MEKDQPVYAFQARVLNGELVENTSVEEMARAFVEELRQFQPEGPYFLGGFCLGGLLALEAAQQLTAEGQEVTMLVLIQTTHPDALQFKPTVPFLHRWWYQMIKRIDLERENRSHAGKAYLWERYRRAWDMAPGRG